MSVLVLFHFEAASGNEEAVKERLAAILPDTRAFDGCEGVTTWQEQDRPSVFVLLEQWASRAQSDAYSDWRAGRVEEDGLRPLLAGRPSKDHYDQVNV